MILKLVIGVIITFILLLPISISLFWLLSCFIFKQGDSHDSSNN